MTRTIATDAKYPLISVVIPVYKVEAYISECIDSVLEQTYHNLEIILVNDGSPDSCPQICDEYAKQDSRIKVIHKENGGLSDARNAGLEIATGKWVSFIDSDDWIEPEFISTLLDTAKSNDADISVCAYTKVYEGGSSVKISADEDLKVMSSTQAMQDLFTYKKYGGVMTWNKLYKTKIFIDNKIKFPVGKIHEDNFTTYKTYYYANKIAYIDTPLVNYRQRDDSIMGQSFDARRLHSIEASHEAVDFVKNNKIPLTQEVQFAVMSSYMQTIRSLQESNNKSEYRDLQKSLLKKLSDLKPILSNNPYLRAKDRFRLRLASTPALYTTLVSIYQKV